jgi:pimeloyl-ACP methyl ester carboxylesterase
MNYTLGRSLIFVALATVTLVLAYLYQRNERVQRARGVWIWPALFTILATQAVFRQLPKDPQLLGWLGIAFLIGVPIGIIRGLFFGIREGEAPGEIRLRPNVVSGAIYLIVFFYNEFMHVFRYGDPSLARFSCAFLVMTAGNSLAVNLTRLIRYRALIACVLVWALASSVRAVAASAGPAALAWSPCSDVPNTQCAALPVPLDSAKPSGATLTLRLARVPAQDQMHKKGVLVFLPGGPGAGIAAIFGGDNRRAQHIDELSRSWDVVVFDPRGVGESSPIRCSPQAVPSPPPPTLQPPEMEYYANVSRANAAFFKSCFDETGELMGHLSSADTAADVEQIRRALTPGAGLVAYAASYGSAYGQAYLERYPTHVKAIRLSLRATCVRPTTSSTEWCAGARRVRRAYYTARRSAPFMTALRAPTPNSCPSYRSC